MVKKIIVFVIVGVCVFAVLLFLYDPSIISERGLKRNDGSMGEILILAQDTERAGEVSRVEIYFRPGADPTTTKSISTISLKITYPSSEFGRIQVVDSRGYAAGNTVSGSIIESHDKWSIVAMPHKSDDEFYFDILAVYTDPKGYFSNELVNLVTFYVSGVDSGVSGRKFDVSYENSMMLTKNKPVVNLLNEPYARVD